MSLEIARKLVLAGDEDSLETRDLLALVLGSKSAASHLIGAFTSLGSLEEACVNDLIALPTLGHRRVASLKAALALVRRRGSEPPLRGRPLLCSEDVYELLRPLLCHERREVLFALALDARNRLLRSPIVVAMGSLTQAALEPRELLRPLIMAASASALIAHNHPSSCPEPSPQDVDLSRVMFEGCSMVGIRLLDHLIVGDGAYVSLADRGLM